MTATRAKTHLLEVMEALEEKDRRIAALERELVVRLDELRRQGHLVVRLQQENAALHAQVSGDA